MSQPPNQDFTNSVDYTVIPVIDASELNAGFSTLVPTAGNTNTEGDAIVLTTTDTAVGVPAVPDPTANANANARWTRYVWNRRPNAADIVTRSTLYAWNDANVNDGTLLKWLPATTDLTSLQAQVTAAQTSANTALNAANTANTNSGNALTQSTAAVTIATSAANSVAQAEADASAAAVAATIANSSATAAVVTANGASAVATSALSIAQQSRTITNLQPGGTGQRIRVNYALNPALEYFNVKDTIAIVTESYATGTPGVNGGGTKPLNTIKSDTGGLVTLINAGAGAGGVQLATGIYRYYVRTKCNKNLAVNCGVQLFETTGGTVIDSVSDLVATGVNTNFSMEGILTTAGGLVYIVKFGAASSVFGGFPANLAGYNETYTVVVFERIG